MGLGCAPTWKEALVSVRYAILGLLSWRSFSGYDIKKAFADSTALYWSGNSNQIYPALVAMRQEGLVTSEVQQRENYPAKKMYTITAQGLAELKRWLLTPPEAPRPRSAFLTQLAWADLLSAGELEELLGRYEEEVRTQLLMQKEKARRDKLVPRRTPRESVLWDKIAEHDAALFRCELEWLDELRAALKEAGR